MLEKLRQEIDQVDRQIIEALKKRYELAGQIGECKRGNSAPFYVPEREAELFAKIDKINSGVLDSDTLRAIYREIVSGARKLESPMVISYLGPEGTHSHQAAFEAFGSGAGYWPSHSVCEALLDVEAGRADYCVVPVENSAEGVVNPTLDALIKSELKIIREFNMAIRHQLIGIGPLESIECIYSHAQVFGQCRNFLANHLPKAQLIEQASTVRAVETAQLESHAAALASKAAAEKYKLPILLENVEDDLSNTTRFLVIGKQSTRSTGHDKTSLCFALNDKVGALQESLDIFRRNEISLTLIESRPLREGRWQYYFFVDIAGHIADDKVRNAFAELEKISIFCKHLGSYPKAE